MILPIVIFPISYMISDFLLDQMREIQRLEKLSKKTKDSDKKAELREQKTYLYNQGLQALRRYEGKVPECVKEYFLRNGKKPAIEEIVKEFKDRRRVNYKLIRIVIAALIVLLTILAVIR